MKRKATRLKNERSLVSERLIVWDIRPQPRAIHFGRNLVDDGARSMSMLV